MPWAWLAWATPLVVGMRVAEPRLATNRPSYGTREFLQTRPDSWPLTVRRWLWSAIVAFASLPLVLNIAAHLAPLPSTYPDHQIPGLAAGLLSAAAAFILAALTLGWAALERLASRRNQPTPAPPR